MVVKIVQSMYGNAKVVLELMRLSVMISWSFRSGCPEELLCTLQSVRHLRAWKEDWKLGKEH